MEFNQITDRGGNQLLENTPGEDLWYSFGTLYPGALQLHNYPQYLQNFTRPDGKVVDLAAIDVMRMREFGVPRYTLFRELLHLQAGARLRRCHGQPAVGAPDARRVRRAASTGST